MGFKRRGYLGSCALTVLGLAKGVTPVVSVTGKRVREHAGLRVPCGGLRLPLWLRGLVWYLEAHLFQQGLLTLVRGDCATCLGC